MIAENFGISSIAWLYRCAFKIHKYKSCGSHKLSVQSRSDEAIVHELWLNSNQRPPDLDKKRACSLIPKLPYLRLKKRSYVFEKDGISYVQLFQLAYTDLDLMNKGYTDLQIAKRLLEYRENDA